MPGTSRIWILAPLYSRTPGMHVNVVNSYAAVLDSAFVIAFNSVDFPTEENPRISRPIRSRYLCSDSQMQDVICSPK